MTKWTASDAADEISTQLHNESFVVLDHFCGAACSPLHLRAELAAILNSTSSRRGRIGVASGSSASRLRGDLTAWEEHVPYDSIPSLFPLAEHLSSLASLLSMRLLEARDLVMRSGAQLSMYPGDGARYVRHVDNTCTAGAGRLCNGRRLSAVFYVNPTWTEGDGGQLRILSAGSVAEEVPLIDVQPIADRLLLFWSDERVPHEVLPSLAARFAVTVWLLSESECSSAARCQSATKLPIHPNSKAKSAATDDCSLDRHDE